MVHNNYLYRFEQEYDEHGIEIVLRQYKIAKYTKCGVWIIGDYIPNKFVNQNARKQFASKTKKEDLEQFIYRKSRHVSILDNQLNAANVALKIAIDMNNNDEIKNKRHCFDGFLEI